MCVIAVCVCVRSSQPAPQLAAKASCCCCMCSRLIIGLDRWTWVNLFLLVLQLVNNQPPTRARPCCSRWQTGTSFALSAMCLFDGCPPALFAQTLVTMVRGLGLAYTAVWQRRPGQAGLLLATAVACDLSTKTCMLSCTNSFDPATAGRYVFSQLSHSFRVSGSPKTLQTRVKQELDKHSPNKLFCLIWV